MRFSDLLEQDVIQLGAAGAKKESIIESLVQLLANLEKINDSEEILRAVLTRENALSTGVGHGVAVPHAITRSLEEPVVALSFTKDPVDWQSLDGSPVHLVFLLLAPAEPISLHLKLLSRVSRICNNLEIRKNLIAATSAEEVISIISSYEDSLREL